MSYELIELSADQGTPVELYEFSYTGTRLCYTSAAEDIVKDNILYTAFPMQRSKLSITDDLGKQNLTLNMAMGSEIAELFRVAPPSEVVTLTVYRKHLTDNQSEFYVQWVGRVLNATWSGQEVELHAESALTSLNRKISRRRFSPQCSHQLYSPACGVNRNDYEVVGTVTEIAGNVLLTTTREPDGWFAGGYLTWQVPNSARIETRSIMRNTDAGEIELNSAPVGLRSGTLLRLYPGCDHTLQTCHAKFDNALNFSGFPFFPDKNPFGDAPLF